MKNNTLFLILFLCTCYYNVSIAQISFSDRSILLSDQNHHSGVAISIIDMNGDGLDDIVRQNNGTALNIELQTQPNQKFEGVEGLSTGFSPQWSMCIADIDNDGTNEILTGGTNDEIVVVKRNEGDGSFKKYVLPASYGIFVQGSNFVDIDNDGFVDVFACDDVAESRIWKNNGDGTFVPRDNWIDMSINDDSGEPASGNYGSTWLDIDNDGDIDLYIAKCRQGVTDVTDKRRINQLYINDGNGNFEEKAAEFNLNVSWQSWTADFQDVNNDGWLDCLITNHDHNTQLFLNDGNGNFIELEDSGINVLGFPIQGLMIDFDNDGFLDVVTTGSQGQLFRNNGDLTFTEISGLFDDDNMESLAIGDLNGDGYLDIYGGYANIFNNPSSVNDKLWMNDGGDNNFVAIALQGQESNRNAIGARVSIFGEWGVQIREVRSGESYGISNTNVCHFGIGQSESIDSVIVQWPSGLVQTEYNLQKNSKAIIVEGLCVAKSPVLAISGATEFCLGDSVMLSIDENYSSYLWSDNSEESSIIIHNQGNYSVQVTDSEGCIGFSKQIPITVDPKLFPKIESNGPIEFCQGDQVELKEVNLSIDEEDIVWSNGDIGFSTIIESSGLYKVKVTGLCSDFESDIIEVEVFEIPNAPEAFGDSIDIGETAVVSGVGNNLAWYDQETAETPIGIGSSIEIDGLTANSTFYAEDRSGSGINDNVGMEEHKGSLYGQNTGLTYSLVFDAHQYFTLDSVKVYTDLPGLRKILLFDDRNDIIASKLVDIDVGETVIYIGFEIPKGENYRIRTDVIQNFETTGNSYPRLQRSSLNVNYPYKIEDVVEIKGANFTQQYYYYFYDWSITSGVFCAGERTEVQVAVNESVATIDGIINEVLIYPNPSQGKFTIEFENYFSNQTKYSIVDLAGKIRVQNKINNEKIISVEADLESGMYILQLLDGNELLQKKIIIE